MGRIMQADATNFEALTNGDSYCQLMPVRLPKSSRSYYQVVMADSPDGYWRMGQATLSTNEVAGANSGYTLTYNGGNGSGFNQQVSGLLRSDADKAVQFLGSGFALGNGAYGGAPFDYNRSFSLEAIIKTTAGGAVVGRGRNCYYVRIAPQVQFLQSQVATIGTGATNVQDGLPHHIVVTVDASGNWKIYVDGALDASGTTAVTFSSQAPLLVGVDYFSAPNIGFFTGTIDEVAVYGFALSASQVAAHAAAAFS